MGMSLTVTLRSIKNQVVSGTLRKPQAKKLAKREFEKSFDAAVAFSKSEVLQQVGRVGALPPVELKRLKSWKAEEIANFNSIIDAV